MSDLRAGGPCRVKATAAWKAGERGRVWRFTTPELHPKTGKPMPYLSVPERLTVPGIVLALPDAALPFAWFPLTEVESDE